MGIRVLRLLASAVCFALGFALASLALRRDPDLRATPEVGELLAHLRQPDSPYDTLFIGSSRILHQIDPEVFDRYCAAAGFPTHSFNCGLDGLTYPELPFLVEAVLRHRPPHLRRIFLDLNPVRTRLMPGLDETTQRIVYWHDWPRLLLVLRELASRPDGETRWGRLVLAARHTGMFALNLDDPGAANVIAKLEEGRGERASPRASDWMGYVGFNGFVPWTAPMPPEEASIYAENLAEYRRAKGPAFEADPLLAQSQRELAARIQASGVEVYYIANPIVKLLQVKSPDPTHTLDFSDPAQYPELFLLANRYDRFHLNATGAALFTPMLAEQFVKRAGR